MKKGIDSLKDAVLRDTKEAENCFNENGCDHEFQRMQPETNPRLIEMGFTRCCRAVSKCSHKFCNKYKWIIERAKHYAEKTEKTFEEILEVWESDRTYWYMNYYQECNQPLLEGNGFYLYEDWVTELKKRFGDDPKKWQFVCPSCGNIQTIQDFIDYNIENPEGKVYYNCIGRYVQGKGCDWTLGGLLKIHSTVVIQNGRPVPVFDMASVKEAEPTKAIETINSK